MPEVTKNKAYNIRNNNMLHCRQLYIANTELELSSEDIYDNVFVCDCCGFDLMVTD